jgi:hypothetical protein
MREILDQAHHILSLKMTCLFYDQTAQNNKRKRGYEVVCVRTLGCSFQCHDKYENKLMYNKINNDEQISSLQSNGSL